MSDKTRQERARGETGLFGDVSGWILPAVMAFVCVAALIAGNAASPYLFKGATLESGVAAQLRATTGLVFSAGVSGRFDLLPQPRVVFYKVHVTDPTGALDTNAEEFDGDVRLLPLIVGRIELSSATLIRPHLTIDLDGRPMLPDSLIGRAVHLPDATSSSADQRLGTVTLVDGTATIKSKALRPIPDLYDVNVTLDWRDLDSPATLTGSLTMGKTSTDVAAWIAQPSSLIRRDHSAVAFHIHSAPFDLSANGDLVGGATTAFRGHVATKIPAAAALLDRFGVKTSLLAPLANLSLNSEASVNVDQEARTTIDLQSLTLHADGNEYEGTLAFQNGARPSLSGTLASEQLMLAPFLNRVPALRDAANRWSEAPIIGREPQLLDLDLRISATHMRIVPFTVDDAALAVMTRADRTEIALVEGKAYGGSAKARVSIGASSNGVSLRGTGSLEGVDASTMTWDAFGRQLVTGSLSATGNFEASGDSPAALIRGLQGWVKGSVLDGEVPGIDVGRAVLEMRRNHPDALARALHGGRTSFQSLIFSTRVVDGVATMDDGKVKLQGADLTLQGNADLGERRLEGRAIVSPNRATTGPSDTPVPLLVLDIKGAFDKVRVEPEAAGARPASPQRTKQAK